MRHTRTSRTYGYIRKTVSVDPVREILLLTNGAAAVEINNTPNNPIPYTYTQPISMNSMKYIRAYIYDLIVTSFDK